MARKVFVIGVGMTKFEKPGGKDWDYPDMAKEAGTNALTDAGIAYDEIEQVAVGYCYGDSTAGQRALYEIGVSGVPVVNVNNNCATGSSALYLAKRFIEGGLADCTLALGFEKMEKGSLGIKYMDRAMPMQRTFEAMNEKRGFTQAPPAPQMFGNAGREYMERYGVKAESFARIAEKNHRHSANNPYSQFQDIYTLEEILASPMVHEPLTKLQCCPTSDGSAAAILASEDFVRSHGLEDQAVEIIGHVDEDRLPVELRLRQRHEVRRLRHVTRRRRRRSTSSPGTARPTSTSSSCTTASRPTRWSPTRRSGFAPRAGPASSSTRVRSPTAATGS